MIALIDYRAGNLTSIRKALAAVGLEVYTPERPEAVREASGVIVPGVGNFKSTAILDEGWHRELRAFIGDGRPFLGVCLGLHFLFEGSEEAPGLPGLGVLRGRCRRLRAAPDADPPIKVPHVGWNRVDARRPAAILAGIDAGAFAYFTHSYVAPVTEACVSTTTHGETFASVVETGRVVGAQFHPEKSSEAGLQLLRNFGRLASG
ncbi:MAG: imidazole glycerol phosphate synthase subunit HisH [Vicinamibacterales bacterium]